MSYLQQQRVLHSADKRYPSPVCTWWHAPRAILYKTIFLPKNNLPLLLYRIRWLIPKLAQSKDQGRLNVCDETNNCYQINCASARMFIFWWYCAREWFYQGGRYKTLALNLDNLWIAIVKLGSDMRQAGNQKHFLHPGWQKLRRSVNKGRKVWNRTKILGPNM